MHETRRSLNPVLRRAGIGIGIAMGVGATAAPTGIAGATPSGSAGAEAAPASGAAVTTAEPPPAAPRPAPPRSMVLAGSACPNPNPTDARNVHGADIVDRGGYDVGDVTLQYSPSARCVRAAAICTNGGYVNAHVFKPSTGQFNAFASAPCGTKAITPWVNDAGIQQLAIGEKFLGGVRFGYGQTAAY